MKTEAKKLMLGSGPVMVTMRRGSLPALVFIHGNSLSRELFKPFFESPELEHLEMICWDLPGHGESPPPEEPESFYSMQGYTAHLGDLLDCLVPGPYLLVGFSLGGHIAMQAVASKFVPEPVGLVTIGSPPLESPADFPAAFRIQSGRASLFDGEINPSDAEDIAAAISPDVQIQTRLAQWILAADPAARINLFRNLSIQPFINEDEFVHNTDLPLLVCFGEKEQVVKLEFLEAKGLTAEPADSIRILPQEGHLPDFSRSGGFTAELLSFLERL
jgi:pimeloyl-ACP methyl ester carboxylesterase